MRKAAPQPVKEIDLVKLRAVLNRLLDHIIETRGVRTLALDQECYWEIGAPARYDVGADPGEIEVGNLADDWEFVSRLSQANEPPVAYQLTELAPLLAYVGEALGEKFGPHGG
ncbi:MAG: hypothetical protein K0S96_2336 [Geminicoccaceae bacterium]|jgi:hypothetical protein|nr:hypothetical protein [Geminicoccaceae bacterium]